MRIGVISDTHGLVRPEALEALAGSDAIVHAGDVGGPQVLEALAALAPVHAIRGNVDLPAHLRKRKRRNKRLDPDWARELPDRRTVTLGGARLHLVHARADLDLDPAAEGIDAVICGHSHAPSIAWEGDVLFLNPGSAGPRRFRLPVAVARLDVADGTLAPRIVELRV